MTAEEYVVEELQLKNAEIRKLNDRERYLHLELNKMNRLFRLLKPTVRGWLNSNNEPRVYLSFYEPDNSDEFFDEFTDYFELHDAVEARKNELIAEREEKNKQEETSA